MHPLYKYLISGTVCILLLFSLIYFLEPTFFSNITSFTTQVIGVASAVGTIIAAWATWQVAKEAAKSADIARKSMEASGNLQQKGHSERNSGF